MLTLLIFSVCSRAWFFPCVGSYSVLCSVFFLFLLFTPGVVWGALGGLRPLFLGGQGELCSPCVSIGLLAPYAGVLPPVYGGVGGGLHKSLLDILVLTDTGSVSVGGSGARAPEFCKACGMPIRSCFCVRCPNPYGL